MIYPDLKLEIFYKGVEIKLKTSLIDIIPIKIWFYFKACSRNKDGKGGQT